MEITVNGRTQMIDVADDTPLLWVIRDSLNLTGTKYGCGMSLCGACTVHLDGQPIRSCVTPVSMAVGKKITTIEGLNSKVSRAVQDAWIELSVPQCGYCQSGQIMVATDLLTRNPTANEQEIVSAMTGNICRCGAYSGILSAIKKAAQKLSGSETSNG